MTDGTFRPSIFTPQVFLRIVTAARLGVPAYTSDLYAAADAVAGHCVLVEAFEGKRLTSRLSKRYDIVPLQKQLVRWQLKNCPIVIARKPRAHGKTPLVRAGRGWLHADWVKLEGLWRVAKEKGRLRLPSPAVDGGERLAVWLEAFAGDLANEGRPRNRVAEVRTEKQLSLFFLLFGKEPVDSIAESSNGAAARFLRQWDIEFLQAINSRRIVDPKGQGRALSLKPKALSEYAADIREAINRAMDNADLSVKDNTAAQRARKIRAAMVKRVVMPWQRWRLPDATLGDLSFGLISAVDATDGRFLHVSQSR